MTSYIYKNRLLQILKELSDIEYQKTVWMNTGEEVGESISYVEATCGIFDDALVSDALKGGEIIFDNSVTNALQELDELTSTIDGYKDTLAIINDPKMELVRRKAEEILQLIEASDMSQNTVEFIEPGQSVDE